MIEFDVGQLADPIMLASFEGWNDAAESASGALSHLVNVWNAVLIGELDPDDYYDFQVNRPTIAADSGEHAGPRITWPTTRFYLADLENGRKIVLMRGVEPNMRWRGFCDELVGACRSLNVSTVVTLAALLGDAPHTRPVPVRGTSSNRELRERWSMEPSTYEGPTGIVGVFQDACTQAGLPAASFWAAVPYYVPQPPCPNATLVLLQRVEDALDVVRMGADMRPVGGPDHALRVGGDQHVGQRRDLRVAVDLARHPVGSRQLHPDAAGLQQVEQRRQSLLRHAARRLRHAQRSRDRGR